MWPPVGAFMWMQHAKSRLQDHHRERVFEPAYSEVIRRLSALSADICALFPGRVPRHIRCHIFAVIRCLSTLILLQANNTNKY